MACTLGVGAGLLWALATTASAQTNQAAANTAPTLPTAPPASPTTAPPAAHKPTSSPVAAARLKPGAATAAATAAPLGTAHAPATPPATCPPPVATPRPKGGPVDDIQGVRPGLTLEEAQSLVLCADQGLVLKDETPNATRAATFGFAVRQGFSARSVPRVRTAADRAAAGKPYVPPVGLDTGVSSDLPPGQVRWFVASFGVPGQERVLHAARRERFAADNAPALDVLDAALKAKYGTPTQVRRPDTVAFGQPLVVRYQWAFATDGRPYGTGQMAPSACQGMAMGPDAGFQYSTSCGVVVQAVLRSTPSNLGIADALDVSTVHLEAAARLLEDSGSALARLDAERAAKEVDEARKRVPSPRL